jgi:hypothetical protein
MSALYHSAGILVAIVWGPGEGFRVGSAVFMEVLRSPKPLVWSIEERNGPFAVP